MKKRIAIYPGSFNPFHIGHLNILEKAEKIFDEVIVAVGINPEKVKNDDLNSYMENKVSTVQKQIPTKNVEGYIGFLTEYVIGKEEGGHDITVVRGLRNGHDFDYEYNQIRYMWDQKPDLKIISLFCDPMYMHVSSSAYRMLEKVKPGSGHKYLAIEKEDEKSN